MEERDERGEKDEGDLVRKHDGVVYMITVSGELRSFPFRSVRLPRLVCSLSTRIGSSTVWSAHAYQSARPAVSARG